MIYSFSLCFIFLFCLLQDVSETAASSALKSIVACAFASSLNTALGSAIQWTYSSARCADHFAVNLCICDPVTGSAASQLATRGNTRLHFAVVPNCQCAIIP